MNAIKSLLAVSVLAAAGATHAATQLYTVSSAVVQPVLFSTLDGSGSPVTYTLASNITGSGTGSLDTSTGILTMSLSTHAQLDITAVVNSALPPGSIWSDSFTTSSTTLATTGAYSLKKAGSSSTTFTCSNGPTDAVGSCSNITLNTPAALFGSAAYYSAQGFTISGGSFTIQSLTAGAAVNTTYTLTPQAAPTVPVPAAAWLFGSGLLGLAGTARRRRTA